MTKQDACGGHGGRRDESCEWCHRWDWFPMPAQYRSIVSDAYCKARYCRQSGEHDGDGEYDAHKADWRQSGQIFDALIEAGLWVVPAPSCECGAPIGDRIHKNIFVSTAEYKGPESPDQHPYKPRK